MEHKLPLRVYYEDVDLAGIVYYGNYFKYIERGRTELLRDLGIDQKKLREVDGLVFVVRKISADFVSPARFDDLIIVKTTIKKLTGARVDMEQCVYRSVQCLFAARVTICIVNLMGQPQRLPSQLVSKLIKHESTLQH